MKLSISLDNKNIQTALKIDKTNDKINDKKIKTKDIDNIDI